MTPDHILIVGSAPVVAEQLRVLGDAADLVICADGGADAVLGAGLTPDLALGDMDSISRAAYARLVAAGVRIVEHPVDKDKTDMELALDHALALSPHRITLLGALGGARLDHTIGNVMLLALPDLGGVDVRIEDERGSTFAIRDSRTFDGAPCDYVSLMPLTPRVAGVVTTGLRFPLSGDTLLQGSTRGISNEFLGVRATVAVAGGCLLVRHERRNGSFAR